MSTLRVPILPIDIERDIFELAATSIRGCAKHLATVARRVHIWIEPIIYRMVTLDEQQINPFLRTIDSKPPAFFAKHVRTLCLTERIKKEDALRVLSVCSGVTNLSISTDSNVWQAVPSLRLQRLAIPLPFLIGRSAATVDLTAFQEMTHLDISDWQHSWMDVVFDLPQLTHLALNFSLHASVANALRNILQKTKSLQVVILSLDIDQWRVPRFALSHLKRHGLDDVRVVALPYAELSLREWEGFERGEPDRWTQAEAIIRRRKTTPGVHDM